MNQPNILIRSMRNGKYYSVTEEGEIDLLSGKQMSVIDLFPYDLKDTNEKYHTYQLRPNSTFLQKLNKVKQQYIL